MSDDPFPPLESCPTCGAAIDITDIDPLTAVECPECGTEFLAGRFLGEYELIDVMGRGGMGVVYRAVDRGLERPVALKLLRPEQAEEGLISKLEAEAAITASINHPHVVKVFTTGTVNGRFFLAMELVDKGTLDDLIELQGRVAEAQALEIAIQMAQGLRAANQHGLIHRDIKPGNILFADAHTAKIVDFGLAIMEEAAKGSDEIWGTPYYVSPERLDQKPEDFRGDIYSLGATIFHAIAGRPPFEAEDATMVALKHLKSQAVSLQAFAPWVSGSTAYVINRTLAKDPAARYASYDELIEHLEYAREEVVSGNSKPAEQKRMILETDEDRQRWGYLTTAMIVLMLLLLLGGGAYWMLGSKGGAGHTAEAPSAKDAAQYETAHQLLLHDQPGEAAPLFQSLAQRVTAEPLLQWSLFQAGLAQLLSGKMPAARATFTALAAKPFTGEPAALGPFFSRVAELGSTPDSIPSAKLKESNLHSYDALALLVAGLKDWELGEFEQGVTMLRQFQSVDAGGNYAWVNDYRELASDYLSDFADYHGALAMTKNAHTPNELQNAATTLRKVKADLKRGGTLSTKLEEAAVAALEKIKLSAADVEAQKQALQAMRQKVSELCREGNFREARAGVEALAARTPELAEEQRLLLKKIDWLSAAGAKPGQPPAAGVAEVLAKITPETAADVKWHAGVYALFAGRREEAKKLLVESAAADPRRADLLPLLVPPGDRDLAKGKPVTASEPAANPAEGPAMAVDGNDATRWVGSAPGPKWLRVDLGQPMTIVRWIVKHGASHGEPPESNTADFSLQRSDDGQEWKEVEAVKGNTAGVTDRRVRSFTARFVRLLIAKGGAAAGDPPAHIYELELHGSDGTAEPVPDLFAAPLVPLIPDLTGTDIAPGAGEPSGATSADEHTGVITLRGGGADIYGNADSFRFLHRPWKGDGQFIIHLLSLERANEFSKGGIMLRDGLGPEAKMVFLGVFPGAKALWSVRKDAGGPVSEKTDSEFPAPCWLKLTRTGNTFAAFGSRDGTEWRQIGSEDVAMGPEAEAGLAVTSHDTSKQATLQAEVALFGR